MTITTNKNALSQLGVRLKISRLDNVEYFCQQANIPGLSLGITEVPTPFRNIPFHGDKLNFNELTVTFQVSEDFENFIEIYKWMKALGFPENFDQHRLLVEQGNENAGQGLYSDGSLLILDSGMNVNFELKFKDLFPISLSDIQMDVTGSSVDYTTCSVSFVYQSYEIVVDN